MKTAKKSVIIFIFLLMGALTATWGQGYTISSVNGEFVLEEERLEREVRFLTDTLGGGRATGTRGHVEAGAWIARLFSDGGLSPVGGLWAHGFRTDGPRGRNIMGFLPGRSDRFVIVLAHYDSLGEIGERFYPGADSNASGVVAMLSLTRMLHRMTSLGKTYTHNVLFVAVDAGGRNARGASALWEDLQEGRLKHPVTGRPLTRDKVIAVANIDIVGSTLSPLKSGRKDYLLAISEGRWDDALRMVNRRDSLGLDLGFDYYGSRDFTRVFYRGIGDHVPFLQGGIPCILFTSGITMRTNKQTDDAASLDYAVLKQRITLIYYWLSRLI